MTEQDAIENMRLIAESGDLERAHSEGDSLVSDMLRQLGWRGFADAYDKAREEWWYA